MSRRTFVASTAATSALLMAGCTSNTGPTHDETPKLDPNRHQVIARKPSADTVASLKNGSLGVSQALIAASSAVVVVDATSDKLATATSIATKLGIPLLTTGEGLTAELDRLQTRTVVNYATSTDALGTREIIAGPENPEEPPKLDGLPAKASAADVLLLVEHEPVGAVAATVAAAGLTPTIVPAPHPGATADSVKAVKGHKGAVVALGERFGNNESLKGTLEVARNAKEFPGGGVAPLPNNYMIALYGHPSTASLGMLGEQPPAQAVARLNKLVEQYRGLKPNDTVIGAFEIITTVASQAAGKQGDYSYRTPIDQLMPWIEAAENAGFYVVLDLQPGRTDFLTQAKEYEQLLKRPRVGLALDPEWRLKPNQKHLQQIGQVDIAEVNKVGEWLAELVRANKLPPKVLTLHQFQVRMITNRSKLNTNLPEIQWLMHVDGQGGQGAKQGTWSVLKKDLPKGVFLGWKNFEDEDIPMLTPAQTVAQVHPAPHFISYQ